MLPHLSEFLAGGGRKIEPWYATLKVVEVAFDDEAEAFENINTARNWGASRRHGKTDPGAHAGRLTCPYSSSGKNGFQQTSQRKLSGSAK